MCGIVGAVAERNVVEILLEGLKRLEYRGYDSAGVALLQNDGILTRIRRTGKVQELADAVAQGEALCPCPPRVPTLQRLKAFIEAHHHSQQQTQKQA